MIGGLWSWILVPEKAGCMSGCRLWLVIGRQDKIMPWWNAHPPRPNFATVWKMRRTWANYRMLGFSAQVTTETILQLFRLYCLYYALFCSRSSISNMIRSYPTGNTRRLGQKENHTNTNQRLANAPSLYQAALDFPFFPSPSESSLLILVYVFQIS